jgi:hypothetical protein
MPLVEVDVIEPEEAVLLPLEPKPAYAPVAQPPEPPPIEESRPASPLKSRRRFGRVRMIASVGLATAVGLAVLVGTGHGLRHERQVAHATSAKAVAPKDGASAGVRPPSAYAGRERPPAASVRRVPVATTQPRLQRVVAQPRVVRLTVSAPSRSSWLEVRRGSAQGRVLYAGELLPGHRLTLRAPKLWTRFGAAANVSIVANGRPLRLQGTVAHVFVPGR